MNTKLDVTIVGGGMITNDLILPSVYQLQRKVTPNYSRLFRVRSSQRIRIFPSLLRKTSPTCSKR